MIISIAVQGNEETNIATETMKQWLLRGLGSGRRSELVTSKHMILVTGSENVAITMKPESVFQIHEQFRCEPFTTFTPATLLVSILSCCASHLWILKNLCRERVC